MAGRVVPFGLVVAAALADGAGAHGLAFDAMLLAVPATAIAGLAAYGEQVEQGGARLHAAWWGQAFLLVVVGAAVRAPAVAEGVAPPLSVAALVCCLAVFCAQAVVALVAELQGQRPDRMPRRVDQRLHREERADRDYQRGGDRDLQQALGGR